ncbi:PKD domain-containing protein [Chitinophaga filiformis]|uniref:PKD domain-containing protein n=1 Tax=Chitinophaga filiformis TaxID=104663 RepID=UPI001F326CFB|nr:PKD domain-containing protein [Chitinophaga filiformis]MCF6402842.1 PKD domain-containing protein [Chitinophaga filiformis]MCF6403240.1 PKD domain-containing protein [Chitinophaga filiformis]
MKRSLLAVLLVFASIGMYANTTIQSTNNTKISQSATDTVPTPDFFHFVRPYGSVNPGEWVATFILSVPGPTERDNVASVDWDFGDGTPPVLNKIGVNHSFYYAGAYNVTMTVRYVTGETFVIEKTIIISM